MEKLHGYTLAHWKQKAEEAYSRTPLSVLDYITVLEEQSEQLHKHNDEMNEITDPREIEEVKQDLFNLRISDQNQKGDYADRLDDGSFELCDDCGTPINSHDHCPRCDY